MEKDQDLKDRLDVAEGAPHQLYGRLHQMSLSASASLSSAAARSGMAPKQFDPCSCPLARRGAGRGSAMWRCSAGEFDRPTQRRRYAFHSLCRCQFVWCGAESRIARGELESCCGPRGPGGGGDAELGVPEAVGVSENPEAPAIPESERPLHPSRIDQLMVVRIDLGSQEWDFSCKELREQISRRLRRERPQALWNPPAMRRWNDTVMLSIEACLASLRTKRRRCTGKRCRPTSTPRGRACFRS